MPSKIPTKKPRCHLTLYLIFSGLGSSAILETTSTNILTSNIVSSTILSSTTYVNTSVHLSQETSSSTSSSTSSYIYSSKVSYFKIVFTVSFLNLLLKIEKKESISNASVTQSNSTNSSFSISERCFSGGILKDHTQYLLTILSIITLIASLMIFYYTFNNSWLI